MGTDISLIKEAREIVRNQPWSDKVVYLRDCADQLAEAYDLIKVTLTRDTIMRLVGASTRTILAINMIVGVEPHPPSSDSGDCTTVDLAQAVA